MSHRDDLLEGAKRCLYEKGYARTTARDIVAASGTNLASIGYHFGSKEKLLNAALVDALNEMSATFTRMTTQGLHSEADAWEEHAERWTRAIAEFPSYRPLLVAQLEAWAQAERSPELRAQLAEQYQQAREHAARALRALVPALDERSALAWASLSSALADGVVLQWLIDPDHAPSGTDVTEGLQALATGVTSSGSGPSQHGA